MNDTDVNLLQEMDRASARLAPHVRKACDSSPSPAVLSALHAAAGRRGRRNRILPFVRFACAAAAMLVVSLTGWLLIRSSLATETERQAALMDDMLFLCTGEQAVPAAVAPDGKRGDRARRLLSLQGLDAATVPQAETPAEPESPPSIESQSRNMSGLQARKCG
ncbi:MAG: hypothetical protein WCI17_05605 [bacterium]